MHKSEHFQKVEKLIEMRAQMRKLSGTVEAIEETIALWRQADKVDEYWETVWEYEQEECNVRHAVTVLKANLEFLEKIAPGLKSPPYFLGKRLILDAEILRGELLQRSLRSTLTVKEKIVRLQGIARKCQLTLNKTLTGSWKYWKQRNSWMSLRRLEMAERDFVLLEAEIEECWAQIWRGPSMAWSDSVSLAG